MRLLLAHSRLPVSWAGEWIYLGQNYLRMRRWEARLSGGRISLSKAIQNESERQRPLILDWIRRQREANGDSLYWWMSHLAGRSNMSSKLFGYIVQIAALKGWVAEQVRDRGDILVICEDGYLVSAVRDNLQNFAKVRSKTGWQLGWLWDYSFLLARAGYGLLRQIAWFWRHARMARRTRPREIVLPKGEIYLVHQCLDDKSFLKEGPLACRYFTVLPTWLEQRGKQVVRLPWLANVNLPLDRVYSRLRASNSLIPEDWLDWSDIAGAVFNAYKSVRAIRRDVAYSDMNIAWLVARERSQQWGDGISFAQFWRYGPAITRWARDISKLVIIDVYEAMPPEHVQAYICRSRLPIPCKVIGYYHSLVSRDMLAFHTPAGEAGSKIFPDLIVSNGPLAQSILIEQGMPAEKIRTGPALRQTFPQQFDASRSGNRVVLLLLLSLIPEATIEALDKINRFAPWIQERLGVPVVVKPHPMMTKESILALMGWSRLPEHWRWYDGDIYEALSSSWCAITLNTASIADVVASGCIPFSLTRALDTPWNYLDFLADQFAILRAVPDDQIEDRLEEIFISRREWFQAEAQRVRRNLLESLNPVNDQTMAAFV